MNTPIPIPNNLSAQIASIAVLALLFLIIQACTTVMPQTTANPSEKPKNPLADNDSGNSLENVQTFRGAFIHGHEVRSLQLCNEKDVLWVIDETGGALTDIYPRFTSKPYEPIFVAIEGKEADKLSDGFGAEYDGTIVAKKLIHASRIQESWGCREKYHEFIFKALGNEPGWNVVYSNEGLQFSSINNESPIQFDTIDRTNTEATVILRAQNAKDSIILTISEDTCSDPMSGELFGWKAQCELNGLHFTGCAKRGDQK